MLFKQHSTRVVKPLRRGNAASTSSILTPFNDSAAGGISSMWRITGWSGPNITPLAIIGTRAYPICPTIDKSTLLAHQHDDK